MRKVKMVIRGGRVFLSETVPVLDVIGKLISFLLAIVSAIGVVVVIKNVMEFSTALQQQDSAGMNSAVKGIVGGAIMAFIGAVLAFLGFTY